MSNHTKSEKPIGSPVHLHVPKMHLCWILKVCGQMTTNLVGDIGFQ
jgi:hypothetical protein